MDNKQAFQKHQKKVKFQVDSKYSILEIIGEGAYGVVASAVDNTNGQRVAIKKICGVFDVPSITKRTLRELKILKHFKHDNVISIKEILRPPSDINEFKDVYVVMDLMGSDLHHIIHSQQELSEEHIRYFLYQLLRGLKYIHSANIIHRDLKPSNLLINKDCELKIGDFGMARSLSASVSEKKRVMTEYVATRWYRAPELMLSVHQFTKAIDVWSVGCIFAEMLGRQALFPGSNYLNQLQLILGVVGVPSVDFMATITSERVRSYIGRLPHKSPVSFATLYPNASPASIELLSELLILDPRKRICVEDALQKPFVEKYHDLDDEPTSRKFDHNIESIPIEREILKEHILQEIQHYHSKRAKPNLAPIQTDLLKTYKAPLVSAAAPSVVRFNDTPQQITGNGSIDQKAESRKRKQKGQPSNNTTSKKKMPAEPTQSSSNELSTQDKELLQRWSNMQKETKPFIHPIRKHMDELLQLKAEATVLPQKVVPQSETVKGQAIIDRVSSTSKMATPLQFTNFVPQQKNGGVTLVAEQTVRMPPISNSGTSVSALNVASAKAVLKTRNAPVLPANKAPQTIFVPVGNGPMIQLPYAFGGNMPIVIFPNLNAAPKVSAPRHIAPKPVPISNLNKPGKVRASSSTVIASSTLPISCVPTCSKIAGVTNCVIDKSKLLPTTNSTVLTGASKLRKSPELTVIPDVVSTSGNAIPSANIHFNVISSKGDNEDVVSIPSDEKSKSSEILSGDLLSARGLCSSAGSFLSELNISSAELTSGPPSAAIPQPQVSPEESAQVIAAVKKLDDEDKKIVSMIEELEETREDLGSSPNGCANPTETTHDTETHSKNIATLPAELSPVTTLPSSHTDWSILKNMLMREKERKKEQRDVAVVSDTALLYVSTSLTSITTTTLPMQTSVRYVSQGTVTTTEKYATDVIKQEQEDQKPCLVAVSSCNSLATVNQEPLSVISKEYALNDVLKTFVRNSNIKCINQAQENTPLSDISAVVSQVDSTDVLSERVPQTCEKGSTEISSYEPLQNKGNYYLPVITKGPDFKGTEYVSVASSVPDCVSSSGLQQQSQFQTCPTKTKQHADIVTSIHTSDVVSAYQDNTSQCNSSSATEFANFISAASLMTHISNFAAPSTQHSRYQENISNNLSPEVNGGECHPVSSHLSDQISSPVNANSINSSVTDSNYNTSMNFTQALNSDNFSILNIHYPNIISSDKDNITLSQFPLAANSTKATTHSEMDNVIHIGVPEIKVEGVVGENTCSIKGEGASLSVKEEGRGSCRMLKPLLLPSPDMDLRLKELKEENNETLLSRISGNLTPLLKCSINDVDDAFLTTFVNTPKTPKSGAGGYGLGVGFEDLFAGTSIDLLNPLRQSTSQSESAPPLSASILSDWLGINDIDPADFEDLQRELESTSYSLLDTA